MIIIVFFHFKAITEIKNLSRETNDQTAEVIRQATENLPEIVQVQLPTVFNLKRCVQRARYGNNNLPVEPASLAELEIPIELSHLNEQHNNEIFLRYDSGPESGDNR